DRALLLAEYADRVREVRVGEQRAHGLVRQKGALGTFCIPNKHLGHPAWQARDGRLVRTTYRRSCLQKERKALEEHARAEGCRLIINAALDYDKVFGPGAKCARLQVLVEFLESMPDDKAEVAFISTDTPHSLTLVGDWFLAEAFAASLGVGYQQ